VQAPLPCALTVVKEANVPRMASLRGKMAARKLAIEPTTAAATGADPDLLGLAASPTHVVRIFSPPAKSGGAKWEGLEPADAAQKLVAELKNRKLV
jgi:electron transfer flavoprotein beta subunit